MESPITAEVIYSQTKYNADLITASQRDVISLIVGVIINGLISLIGTVANIMNMIIFYKQGLNTTINISFFSMAISDLGSLTFQQFCNLYSNPLFVNLDLPIVYHEFQYFTAAILRKVFSEITCLLTVYVTAERCFCITFPLHVKQMITTRRTVSIIVCIYIMIFLSSSPAFAISYIDWSFHPIINRTLLCLHYRKNTTIVEGVWYLVLALICILSFIIIVMLTTVLIYKLHRKSTWLITANVDVCKSETMSNRDKATMLMVILIATSLIICYLPSAILFSVTIFERQFAIRGRYNNEFIVLWSFALLFEDVNSSVNIFFYYNMSTKYRLTFRKLFMKDVQECMHRYRFGANNVD